MHRETYSSRPSHMRRVRLPSHGNQCTVLKVEKHVLSGVSSYVIILGASNCASSLFDQAGLLYISIRSGVSPDQPVNNGRVVQANGDFIYVT
jgi:hypothetical protein